MTSRRFEIDPVTGYGVYVVRAGDSLFEIARHYGVPWAAIYNAMRLINPKSWNGRNPNILYPGETLYIPVDESKRLIYDTSEYWKERFILHGDWDDWQNYLEAVDKETEE